MRPVDRNKDLAVELTGNRDFPDAQKAPPCLVTMKYPFIVAYTSNPTYSHINAKEYNCFNLHKQARRPFTMGPPMDVNDYITFCEKENIIDGRRYAVCADDPDGSRRHSRQKAWLGRWRHAGNDEQATLARRLSD